MGKNAKRIKSYRHSSSFYRRMHQIRRENKNQRNSQNLFRDIHFPPILEDEISKNYKNVNSENVNRENVNSKNVNNVEMKEPQKSILNEIKNWALKHNITHAAINSLLKILIDNGMSELPTDSRTLLKTPAKLNLKEMGSGCYWYNGIANTLKICLSKMNNPLQCISLIFNVDGISTFKSSGLEFWPILYKIAELDSLQPMVAAVYYGAGKPPLDLFFNPFVEELKTILLNGIEINGKMVIVTVKCFICDTPARCFVKGRVSVQN